MPTIGVVPLDLPAVRHPAGDRGPAEDRAVEVARPGAVGHLQGQVDGVARARAGRRGRRRGLQHPAVAVGIDDHAGPAVRGIGRRPLDRRAGGLGAGHRVVDVGHREVQGDRHPAVVRAGQPELGVGVGQVERRAGDVELGVADAVAVEVGVADGVGTERLAVPADGGAGVTDDEVRESACHSCGSVPVRAAAVLRRPRQSGYRWARFTAETTARSEALTMFGSMPTPQRTRSPTAHST